MPLSQIRLSIKSCQEYVIIFYSRELDHGQECFLESNFFLSWNSLPIIQIVIKILRNQAISTATVKQNKKLKTSCYEDPTINDPLLLVGGTCVLIVSARNKRGCNNMYDPMITTERIDQSVIIWNYLRQLLGGIK